MSIEVFTHDSLWFTVESAGLTVEAITIKRYVKKESFLYVRARKPNVVLGPAMKADQSDMKSTEP